MTTSSHNYVLFITGASGFLGNALLHELSQPDSLLKPAEIRLFSKTKTTFDLSNFKIPVKEFIGDICNYDALNKAIKGSDAVIHMASVIDWGAMKKSDVFKINLHGTKNVLKACGQNAIKAMVYTGSVDSVFSGKPILNADSTLPYPKKFSGAYAQSKALAEQAVLNNRYNGLKTAILRPSGIYGEHDPYHITSLVNMSKHGVCIKIGSAKTLNSLVYSGNVAHAHILCTRGLLEGHTPSGKTYFITDNPPKNFFETLCPILKEAGIKFKIEIRLPPFILYPSAAAIEAAAFLIRPFKRMKPAFSRFSIKYITTDFTFNINEAEKDFNYTPKYSKDDAKKRTALWIKNQF